MCILRYVLSLVYFEALVWQWSGQPQPSIVGLSDVTWCNNRVLLQNLFSSKKCSFFLHYLATSWKIILLTFAAYHSFMLLLSISLIPTHFRSHETSVLWEFSYVPTNTAHPHPICCLSYLSVSGYCACTYTTPSLLQYIQCLKYL